MPAFGLRVGHQFRVPVLDLENHAGGVRVIGDRHPVKRTAQLCGQAHRRHDLFAAGKAQRLFRAKRRTEGPGIDGPSGVNVLIAPQGARRVVTPGIG